MKLFKSDPALFSSYHQGYQHQAAQWPLDPLNTLMTDILRQDSSLVIADLGCGEARLARSVGTNMRDFVFEAARILKVGGVLKIAELESRFQGEGMDVDTFIASLQKFGLKNNWKDLKKDFFYFLDFTKVADVKKKKKLPDLSLKACLYKKR